MDVSWVKPQLMQMFGINPTNQSIEDFIREKIRRFNGKLYKYFSFSENDANHALDNLENGILYFSKPEHFNDPFDCALGFSIEKALKEMLPQLLNDKINIKGENAVIKDFVEKLLCGNAPETEYDDPTIKLIGLLYSHPKTNDMIQRMSRGESIQEDELQASFLEALADKDFASRFFSLITDPSKIDTASITERDIMKAVLSLIQHDPGILASSGIQLDDTSRNIISVIRSISAEESIVDRIERIAEASNLHGIDIKTEVANARKTLEPILPRIKETINEHFAITCFSETPDNILMWSHYAGKHSGFCVEYDFTKMTSQNLLLMLFPAIYSTEKPTVPLSMFDFNDLGNIRLSNGSGGIPDLIVSLLTKSNIWSYENEWRMIGYRSMLRDQKYYEDIAVKVYYGANISTENKQRLDEIVRRKGIGSAQFRIDDDRFKLKLC